MAYREPTGAGRDDPCAAYAAAAQVLRATLPRREQDALKPPPAFMQMKKKSIGGNLARPQNA